MDFTKMMGNDWDYDTYSVYCRYAYMCNECTCTLLGKDVP